MNSERPSDETYTQPDETAAANGNADPALSDNANRGWLPVAAIAGIFVVTTALGLYLFLTPEAGSNNDRAAAEQGLACPSLQKASDAFSDGDQATFHAAIERASKMAEDALQRSGRVFGRPERIALELWLTPNKDPDHIKSLLDLAQKTCLELGSS
jgi:hypothetical protein